MHIKNIFGILIVCVFVTMPSEAAEGYSEGQPVGSGLAVYELGMPDCTYKIKLKIKSYAVTNEDGSVGFSEPGGPNDERIRFSMICKEGGFIDYCETTWRSQYVDIDPATLKITKQKFHENIFREHKAIVFSANTGAVNEPRPRQIYFCISAGRKHINGRVEIGNEINNFEKDAISILKTLEIN